MAENKKSFVLYTDIIHMVRKMPKDSIADLFLTILSYVNDENPVIENLLVDIAFEPIKLQLKRDLQKYEGTKDAKSLNGRIGNLKRYHLDIYNRFNNNELTIDEAEELAKSRKPSLSEISDNSTSQNVASVAVTDTVTVTDTVIKKEANAYASQIAEYSEIIKDKKHICQFITNRKPKFINPFVDLWNIFAGENEFTTVTKINDTRKKIFRTRIRDESFDFITVLSIAKKCEFILEGRHWFTFDWIFKNDSNYLKVIEGKFDDAAKQSHNQQNANINEQLKAAKTSNAA